MVKNLIEILSHEALPIPLGVGMSVAEAEEHVHQNRTFGCNTKDVTRKEQGKPTIHNQSNDGK